MTIRKEGPILRRPARIILALPVAFVVLHTAVRIVSRYVKFPMPHVLANFIDNPIRRLIQPPDATAVRHGIEPGMRVLDVGPGNGRYTVAAARRVGPTGHVVAVDVQHEMCERTRSRAAAEGIQNIEVRTADVRQLPFPDESFDLAYLITVIGEVPDPRSALYELHRVLAHGGKLIFSELLPDPDYWRAGTLTQFVETAGFQLKQKLGNLFYYTLVFEKRHPDAERADELLANGPGTPNR